MHMYYKTQDYKGIPLVLIKNDYKKYKAKRFRINGSKQNVWIPNVYLSDTGVINPTANIDFIFSTYMGKRKLELANVNVVIGKR